MRPVHRGVYQVGPLLSGDGRCMAAVLAAGPGALLSHGSGARLWALAGAPAGEDVEDVVLSCGNRRRPGIRVHRVLGLRPGDRTRFRGIPVTAPARTILDVATRADERGLARMMGDAVARRLTTEGQLTRLLEQVPRHPGAGRLRALLGFRGGVATRSQAEERFLALLRAAGAPRPETNVRVHGREVDFLWRSAGLVVEVDGRAYHSSAAAFQRDRRKDQLLVAAGCRVMRVTWRQLEGEPHAVVFRVATALAAAR